MTKKQAAEPADDGGDDGVGAAKLYKADVRDLKQLAALMDVPIADAYRAVCARVVSAALASAARQRAAEAERDARRTG